MMIYKNPLIVFPLITGKQIFFFRNKTIRSEEESLFPKRRGFFFFTYIRNNFLLRERALSCEKISCDIYMSWGERRDETLCEKSGPFENAAILSRFLRHEVRVVFVQYRWMRTDENSIWAVVSLYHISAEMSVFARNKFRRRKRWNTYLPPTRATFFLPPPPSPLVFVWGRERRESTLGSSDITSSFLFLWLSRETLKIPSYNRPAGGMLSWKLHSHDWNLSPP